MLYYRTFVLKALNGIQHLVIEIIIWVEFVSQAAIFSSTKASAGFANVFRDYDWLCESLMFDEPSDHLCQSPHSQNLPHQARKVMI